MARRVGIVLSLLLLLAAHALGAEEPEETVIAVFVCREGRMVLDWYAPGLNPEVIQKLKKQEGAPCQPSKATLSEEPDRW